MKEILTKVFGKKVVWISLIVLVFVICIVSVICNSCSSEPVTVPEQSENHESDIENNEDNKENNEGDVENNKGDEENSEGDVENNEGDKENNESDVENNEDNKENNEGNVENNEGDKENNEGDVENNEGDKENNEGDKENNEGDVENNEGDVKIEPVDSGIYTFYNKETGCYLSHDGNSLILSSTPSYWDLKSVGKNGFNVYAYDTTVLLDIDNAYVAEGTTVKLWDNTGYDVQVWNVNGNANGTYSLLYSGDNQYCLGFDNGNAVLQIRNKSNSMQEWVVVDVTDTIPKNYLSFESEGGIIELQLPLDILDVISETRIQQWANDLETAYYSFYELTNYIPYENIIVEAYKSIEYIAYVMDYSNIIYVDCDFIYNDLEKMAARACDWNFCVLHEMGHMFDSLRPWNFESEMLTDLKLAYVLEKNNAAAAPSEFAASEYWYGIDIMGAYGLLGGDFSEQYNIYGCAERFLEIKEDIGWEPFKQTFHYLQENEADYINASRQEKFENFIDLLSQYSDVNIKGYFSDDEWNTIIGELN